MPTLASQIKYFLHIFVLSQVLFCKFMKRKLGRLGLKIRDSDEKGINAKCSIKLCRATQQAYNASEFLNIYYPQNN